MEQHVLKRSWSAYHEEAPPAPPIQDFSQHAFPPIDVAALTPHQQHTLHEAASILNVSFQNLLRLHHYSNINYILRLAAAALHVSPEDLVRLTSQHHSPKRRRLDSVHTVSGPPSHCMGHNQMEKSQGNPMGHQAGRDPRREQFDSPTEPDSLLGWPSRIADCLSSMSVCQPSGGYESDSGYQEVASAAAPSYGYAGSRGFPVGTTATHSPPTQVGFAAAPARPEAPDFFAHAGSNAPHYLPGYPPLQPTRPAAAQPTTAREAMFYPHPVDDASFSRSEEVGHFQQSDQRAQAQQYGHPAYADGIMGVPEQPIYGQNARLDGPLAAGSGASGYSDVALVPQGGRPMPYMQPVKAELDFAHPNQKQPPAKRGPFKNKDLKEGTAMTRKVGSCMRCRIQRIRCDDSENAACGACSKITAKHPWRLPCLRLKITDIILGKPGQVKGLEWTRRWKENAILDTVTGWQWASSEDKVIQVTDVYGTPGHYLELSVRQFVPSEDDRTDRSWVAPNGEKKSVQLPAYAITDIDAAKKACTDFVKQSFSALCEKLIGNQPLLKMTYTAALMRRGQLSVDEGERQLLQYTVDLWSSIRLTTTSFQIVGKERLGMPQNLMDETSPLNGKTPLPPVMGAQIDSVLIHDNQNKLRHYALEKLNEITLKSKLKSWFTTYLVSFILLHNISLVMRHDASYARKHGLKRRFARVEQVQQYHKGATTLLAYFHYTNKGVFPFSPECKGQHMRTLADLSDEDIALIRTTGIYAAQHKAEWQRLWDEDDYENEHYFISQLYEPNWQPRQMKI